MRNYLKTIRVALLHIREALPRLKPSVRHLRGRRLVIVFIVAIALAGVIGGWWLSRAPVFEHVTTPVKVAHASPGSSTGCAACHTTAISFTTCTDCHAAGSTSLDGAVTGGPINFPHHDSTAPARILTDCQNSSCHDGVVGDARFALVPVASHTYCDSCHVRTHSGDCPDTGFTVCSLDCTTTDACEGVTYITGTCACTA